MHGPARACGIPSGFIDRRRAGLEGIRRSAGFGEVPAGYAAVMEDEHDESDQLPEDAPPERARSDGHEDEGADEDAEENAGVPNEEGQATGNPAAAG